MVYQDAVIVDMVVHAFNYSQDNCKNQYSEEFADGAYGRHQLVMPERYQLDRSQFRKDIQPDELADVMFTESATDAAVYQAVAITDYFEDGLISLDKGIEFCELEPDRGFLYGSVNPLLDDALVQVEYQVEELDIEALKLYPARFEGGESISLWLDDPDSGKPIVEKAKELGVEKIAVHKNVPIGRTHQKYFHAEDIEEAAAAHPELEFEIVHAGYSFEEETNLLLARFPNVYANLESTMGILLYRPREFAHSIGKMLLWAGPDRIMYGSGCTTYHPQILIEAFWDFQIPKDMREEYGYPKLTDDIKRKILGLNACEYLGIDPDEVRKISDDRGTRADGSFREPWTSVDA